MHSFMSRIYSGKASQRSGNSVTTPASNSDVKMKLVSRKNGREVWLSHRGVVELLQVSDNVTPHIYSNFGCTVTLNADKGTVTIDGNKATEAGRWLETKLALVKVDRTLHTPVFIAAMRLRDVASEVVSTLKQFPASFELTPDEFAMYTWHEVDLKRALSAILDVIKEVQVEVYEFANNSRTKQLYSRLADWTTHYAHSVFIQVDQKDHRIYHIAGLAEHVKLLCENLLPFSRHKIVRRVTPSQAQLLLIYEKILFNSADDCLMTLSGDNSEMVVYCTQRVEAEVMQKCDRILNQIVSDSCTVARDSDTDMTAITNLLNGIEIEHRVIIQCEQSESDNRDDRMTVSKQMFVGPSYCVDISDKTQLRLVDADITDLCVDAIVSTIDEHGTPNTALAQHIVAKGGPAVERNLKQKLTRKLNSGSVVMCDGGQLPCKSVIHMQYPPTHLTTSYNNYLSTAESDALKCCIVNILTTCKNFKYKFNSIAIPVIGSYSNKQKLADCMWCMAVALRECVEVIKSLSVRHIVLVAHGTDNFKLFRHQLELVFATDPTTKFNTVDIDKHFIVKNCFVSLITGDLLIIKVDAIVVAIPRDKDLTRSGLALGIKQKDPNIQRQLQDSKWPDEATGSGVIVCESNILASKYVFFIHLLKYTQPDAAQQHFSDAIDACLQQAVKQDIKSIAFPVLGTGVLNYPDDFVAGCMTTSIKKFCQGQSGKCTDIRIVRYRYTDGTVFVDKYENLALKVGGKRLPREKDVRSQITNSRQAVQTESRVRLLQFNITGFNIQSVVSARDSILHVFTGNSGYRDNTPHSGSVETGAANSRDKSPVSVSESSARAVWVYEDTDEQWKEFIPDLQVLLEEDYSFRCEYSTWHQHTPYEREHTVNFTTQPMTYMVKCGDTFELSTVVERRVTCANSWSVVTRGVDERRVHICDDEDEQQVERTPVRQMSHSPTRRASSTNDGSAQKECDNAAISQHVTDNKPSANRKNPTKQQDNDKTIHQLTHEHQSSSKHDPDTTKTEATHVNIVLHYNKPSAIRKVRIGLPDQPSESMEITTFSQSRQLSEDSQVSNKASGKDADATEHAGTAIYAGTNETPHHQRESCDTSDTAVNDKMPLSVLSSQTSGHASVFKISGGVAIATKYMWDCNIPSVPSYWVPMDGSSVKAVVLQSSEYEYQHVEQTFLYSLNSALTTVVQIERIQNPTLYRRYVNNKDIMNKANPPTIQNERHLWHGTRVTMTQHGPMPITAINARGFNKSYYSSSDDAPQVYGNGVYFSVEARGAVRKSQPDAKGHRHMYWCRVLTGEYTRGRVDMVVAPVKTKGTYDLYDSVVDIVESPTVFVIFEDAHAYPEYLITFK